MIPWKLTTFNVLLFTIGLLHALQHSGLQYLLGAFVKSIDKGEGDIDANYRYECAWRLSDWNLPTTQKIMNSQIDNSAGFQNIVSNDYSLFHYHALKSFHESDTDGLKSSLDNALLSIINTLRNISLGEELLKAYEFFVRIKSMIVTL